MNCWQALEEAIEKLNHFRSREGGELAAFMRQHNHSLAESAEQMEKIRSRAQPAFQNRLSEKLQDLLRTVTLDPQRIAQEAALLADRSDIGEEIFPPADPFAAAERALWMPAAKWARRSISCCRR